jgi:O-antigen/teichoic acid export membrane protein
MYGPAAFGFYALGTATVFLADLLSKLGLDTGVLRYVAHHQAHRDPHRVRGAILAALGIAFASSFVVASLMFAGANFVANDFFGKPFMEDILKVFAVSLPFSTVSGVALYATMGFQTTKYFNYAQNIQRPVTNLILIIVLYFLGAQIIGAAAAYVVSTVITLVLAMYYLRRMVPGLFDLKTPAKFEIRPLVNVSAPAMLAHYAYEANMWAALAILGALGTTKQVAIFNVALRTGHLSLLVAFALDGMLGAVVSTLHARGSHEHLSSLYKDVSRWSFTGGLAIFLLTALLSQDIMALFGSEFVSGWTAVIVIGVSQLFNASVGHTDQILLMTDRQRIVLLAAVSSTIVGIVGAVALVPTYGVMGAASATAAAIILKNIATCVAVRHSIGVWPYDRRYIKPLCAGSLAAVGAYLTKATFAIAYGVPTILIITPLFIITFAILLLAFGLESGDRRIIASAWTAVHRRKTED